MAPTDEDVEEPVLAEMKDVYPLGYPTEQYLVKLKNDVQATFAQLREQKQKQLEEMARQMKEGNATLMMQKGKDTSFFEQDPGRIEERGFYYEEEYKMHDHVNGVRIKTCVHLKDSVYNQLRSVLKNETNLSIRPGF